MAMPFTAPPTPFNGAITAHRRVAFTGVPLGTVKAIKDALGVTVNDVILAVCAGALRRYLADSDNLPDRPLVAAVPVSVRGRDTRDGGANQVSGMLVSLPTDETDPVERVRRVAGAAGGAKHEHEALGPHTVGDIGGLAASPVVSAGARVYSRFHLAERVPQPVNLVISNIPGPGIPLYLAGAKLVGLYPLGPIYDGMGLNVTVLSYLDTVGFGFLACRDRTRDLDRLASTVSAALQELEKATGASAHVRPPT